MRILLVQSWLGRDQHPVMPVGLALLAAGLDGHQVRIVDLNLYPDPFAALESELIRFRPDFTGFSLRNCDTTSHEDSFSYLPAFHHQLKLTKSLVPYSAIIAGGAGFSIFPSEIMESCPEIMCGVTGHGEGVIAGVVQNRRSGLVPGSSSEPFQPRFQLLDVSRYIPFQSNLSTGIEVNRGCSEKCRYCSYPVISGGTVQERPVGEIARDIAILSDSGFSHFFFVAPVLNSTGERGAEVAEMAAEHPSSFTWEAYHTPRGFDLEYSEKLAESSCTAVSFSPDGGTAEQLELMGKSYTPCQVEEAVSAAAACGIDVSLNLFPWHVETGVTGMFRGFANGVKWGRRAGGNLRRLRFSLIRRMPDTVYHGAKPSFFEQIPPGQFVKPPAAAMSCFLVLKKLCERSRIR